MYLNLYVACKAFVHHIVLQCCHRISFGHLPGADRSAARSTIFKRISSAHFLGDTAPILSAQLTALKAHHLCNLSTCHRAIVRITYISYPVSDWADS